ncbi:hypothetical protein FQA39_LY16552 [Lamprigera yunnana]|nr:hypothetical protein FQA39_LY16552 [Lamprigera yunnana]
MLYATATNRCECHLIPKIGNNAITAFRFYRSAQPRFPLEALSEATSALNADIEDDVAETTSADIDDCDLWVPEDEEEDEENEEEDEANVENKINDSEIEASGNSRRTNKAISNLKCKNERRKGFVSLFTIKCKVCHKSETISTENSENSRMNINLSAVSAIMSIGAGYRQLTEFSATHAIYQAEIYEIYNKAAVDALKKAEEEEAELAVEVVDVDDEGCPNIAIIADGAWSKRSRR